MNEVLTQVQHAAEVLDYAQPGWHERVDLDELDMECVTTDVAAQLDQRIRMDYSSKELLEMAFVLSDEDATTYEELTDAWRQAVESRLAASP